MVGAGAGKVGQINTKVREERAIHPWEWGSKFTSECDLSGSLNWASVPLTFMCQKEAIEDKTPEQMPGPSLTAAFTILSPRLLGFSEQLPISRLSRETTDQ